MRNHDVRACLRLVLQATVAATAALPGCGGRVAGEGADDAAAANVCSTPSIDAAVMTGCSYVLPVSGDVDACGLRLGQALGAAACEQLCHAQTACELYDSNGTRVQCMVVCPMATRHVPPR
jgi:hypothetical protein